MLFTFSSQLSLARAFLGARLRAFRPPSTLVLLLFVFTLSACGGGSDSTPPNDDNPPTGGDGNPPVEEPPVVEPPVVEPPVEDPPGEGPPVVGPPIVVDPPVEVPPIAGSFTVSGELSANDALQVDSDVNDPFTTAAPNNTLQTAQPIPNPAIVKGYVTATATGIDSDRFGATADEFDVFSIAAFANQSILMEIADFNSSDPASIDLDLGLFDSSGNLLDVSFSVENSFESLLIPADDNYFLVVNAFSGASNYTMSISTEFGATAFDSQVTVANLRVDQLAMMTQPADERNMSFVTSTGHQIAANATSAAHVALNLGKQDTKNIMLAEQRSITEKNTDTRTTLFSMGASAQRSSATSEITSMLETIKHMNSREASDVFLPMYYPTTFQAATSVTDPVPDRGLQWNLFNIGWVEAQDQLANITLQKRPVVAVIDSGLFLSHPDLEGALVDQRDFVSAVFDGDGLIADASEDVRVGDDPSCHGFHGTHVSTTAVAPQNNVGITGVAPGIGLIGIKVGFSSGPNCGLLVGDIANAILYAAGLPNTSGSVPPVAADVINMSLGSRGQDPQIAIAINQAVAQGVIVVAAAGNDGAPIPSFPAAANNVIAVAATDLLSNRAPYSSFYAAVDIAAPGGDISADRNGDGRADGVLAGVASIDGNTFQPSFDFYNGTSMASPTVAAGIALMKGIEPSLTQGNIEAMLAAGDLTTDIGAPGFDIETGFGLMSLPKMIESARQFTAGGNGDPEPVSVVTSVPASLDFGAFLDEITLELVQVGDATVSVSGVSGSDTLMLADGTFPINFAGPDNASGFGVYSFALNRAAIDGGSLSGSLSFDLSDGSSHVVPVSAVNQISQGVADSAAVFYLMQRQNSDNSFETVVEFATLDGVRVGASTSPELPAGTYRIIFGTDTDNDLIICDEGELCGSFPLNNFGFDATFVLTEDISDATYLLEDVANSSLTAFDGTSLPVIGPHSIVK